MRLLLAIFCLSIASVAMAQSKEPSKQPKQTENPCADPCRYQIAPTGPVTINVSPTQTLNASPTEKENEGHKESEWEKWIAIWTGALFFATTGLACFVLWQRFDGADTAKKHLRAYLGATPHDILFIGENWIQTYVDVENTGSTPAKSVTHRTDWAIRSPGDNRNFPLPSDPGFGKRSVTAGSKWRLGFEMQLTTEQLASLQAKTTVVFVWGRIEYIDIFGKQHWLTFRYQNIGVVYGSDAKGERAHMGWALFATPEGNEED